MKIATKILNDWRLTIAFTICSIGFMLFWTFGAFSIDNTTGVIVYSWVLGILSLFSLISTALSIEIISFDGCKVVSKRIYKRVQIPYSEIDAITEMHKHGMGGGGGEDVWEIHSRTGKSIYLIRSPRRKKLLEEWCKWNKLT